MTRLSLPRSRFVVSALVGTLATSVGLTQPPVRPRSGPDGPGGPGGGPPRYELGRLLAPHIREQIELTAGQEKELAELEKLVKEKLNAILTAEQKTKIEKADPPLGNPGRPGGAPGRPGGGGPGGGRGPGGRLGGRPVDPDPDPLADAQIGPQLLTGGSLKVVGNARLPFVCRGDALQGLLGDSRRERNGGGIRLLSGEDRDADGKLAGEATSTLSGLTDETGRWYRIGICGLAQDDFSVEKGDLYLKVEFFKDGGTNSLDSIKKSIVPQVELERKALFDERTNKNLGHAVWRNYTIEVRTPFAEVDTLKVSVGFADGSGRGKQSEFWVREVAVRPIPPPADYLPPTNGNTRREPPALKTLVSLGGRWYFDPRGGDKTPPKQFETINADRLYYLADRLETPFVGNMSAWLRGGYKDRAGKVVERDVFVEDAVTVAFTDKHLVMKSKNLPNHPVAVFPDRTRMLDGAPNVIQEQRNTWYVPLEPKPNPSRAAAMTMTNKQGLPMGPVGVAVNGVVFFSPFDHIEEADAVWRLDRCCGHPSPLSQYHYHKYPVCLNTPWADDGTDHSPLIGFAFDGFPVYGPYEAKGDLAKDSKENPLNDFSLHTDGARGPHYHVTPGKFPHIIGGYWGEVEKKNRGRR